VVLSWGDDRHAATTCGTTPAGRGHEDGRYMIRGAGEEVTGQSGAPEMFYKSRR